MGWKKLLAVPFALMAGFIYLTYLPESPKHDVAPLRMRAAGVEAASVGASISQHEKTLEVKATSEGRMQYEETQRLTHRLPQVLVIGAKKCGTGECD